MSSGACTCLLLPVAACTVHFLSGGFPDRIVHRTSHIQSLDSGQSGSTGSKYSLSPRVQSKTLNVVNVNSDAYNWWAPTPQLQVKRSFF